VKLPRRPKAHIIQTASWKVLEQATPPEWLLRQATERDYGIDCYLEIVWRDNELTGDLCSIQLKGREAIDWGVESGRLGRESVISGVKKTTVNYWMSLPVPVFLMVAEISTGRLYFAPVKEQVRTRYAAYLAEDAATFGFTLYSGITLDPASAGVVMLAYYLKERAFAHFASYLRGLLIHAKDYYEFILSNQGLDCFLDVEPDDIMLLIHIYQTCEFLSQFVGVDWQVISLADAFREDADTWKESYGILHNMTLDRILREMQPVFASVLRETKSLVSEAQSAYWEHEDRLLYRMCCDLNVDRLLEGE